jgi:hypothetical protein
MRVVRKLTLTAMLALAATAIAAPLGFAQTEPLIHNQIPQIIVQNEIPGSQDQNCPAVMPTPATNPAPTGTLNGCQSHAAGSSVELVAHLTAGGTEVIISNCDVEVDIRVDAAGEGYFVHQELKPPTDGGMGTCTRRPCMTNPPINESKAWSFYLRESEPAPRERMTVLFCLEDLTGANDSHCEVTTPVTEPNQHLYRVTYHDVAGHGSSFPRCELGSVTQPAALDLETLLAPFTEGGVEQALEIRHQ